MLKETSEPTIKRLFNETSPPTNNRLFDDESELTVNNPVEVRDEPEIPPDAISVPPTIKLPTVADPLIVIDDAEIPATKALKFVNVFTPARVGKV